MSATSDQIVHGAVGDVRFERREQVVMVLTEDWPNSDDSQARSPTREREVMLVDKTEPVHERRVAEAVSTVETGRGLWRDRR